MELKDPAYFAALGLAMEPNVLNSLRAYNYSLAVRRAHYRCSQTELRTEAGPHAHHHSELRGGVDAVGALAVQRYASAAD